MPWASSVPFTYVQIESLMSKFSLIRASIPNDTETIYRIHAYDSAPMELLLLKNSVLVRVVQLKKQTARTVWPYASVRAC